MFLTGSQRVCFLSGMTALESWCLAMIGLVFEALLAYVLVILQLFKRRTKQVKTSCDFYTLLLAFN